MTVLVTGGCGFIGSHLVDALLAKGERIVIVDDLSRGRYLWGSQAQSPRLIEASILDEQNIFEIFDQTSPRAVYHLAAHHYIPFCEANPYEAFATNVQGTLNIVEAAKRVGSVSKLFFASTGDVYVPSNYPNREYDPPSPIYIYGESKLAAEAILRRYKNAGKAPFDIIIGRLFNAAGSRETNPHLLPEVVRQLDEGSTVIEVGNTWPVRDFVDVKSMASVIVDLTERISGIDVFNIGSGEPQTVEAALNILVGVFSRVARFEPVEARKRPNDRAFLCPSVDKLRNVLGRAATPFNRETARSIWLEPAATRLLYA